MSHFTVLVIGENPEDQLQPYHEYECTGTMDQYVQFVEAEESEEEMLKEYRELPQEEKSEYNTPEAYIKDYHGYKRNSEGKWGRYTNPNAKWDWYVLGGRWTGYFKLKATGEGKVGEHGAFGNPAETGWVDQALLKDIDFEGMREKSYQKAIIEYAKVERLCGGEIPKVEKTWDQLRAEHEKVNDAREAYHAQPSIIKFREASKELGWGYSLEDFQISKEEYGQQAKRASVPTFAVVRDSKWFEKGEMGWWGIVIDAKEQDKWNEEFNNMIKDLPPDTMLSLYDCHI